MADWKDAAIAIGASALTLGGMLGYDNYNAPSRLEQKKAGYEQVVGIQPQADMIWYDTGVNGEEYELIATDKNAALAMKFLRRKVESDLMAKTQGRVLDDFVLECQTGVFDDVAQESYNRTVTSTFANTTVNTSPTAITIPQNPGRAPSSAYKVNVADVTKALQNWENKVNGMRVQL